MQGRGNESLRGAPPKPKEARIARPEEIVRASERAMAFPPDVSQSQIRGALQTKKPAKS